MIDRNRARARTWYIHHRAHVNKMLATHGPQVEPSGSDAANPELWKDIHWRWFMTGKVSPANPNVAVGDALGAAFKAARKK